MRRIQAMPLLKNREVPSHTQDPELFPHIHAPSSQMELQHPVCP